MKDLKWLSIEDYANSPLELMVVGCMKAYLRRMEPEDALRRLSEIIKPKVISLNEGGVPLLKIERWYYHLQLCELRDRQIRNR